ncbi:hypothetical protein ACLB2K_076970 [Fragaria x ananassa]
MEWRLRRLLSVKAFFNDNCEKANRDCARWWWQGGRIGIEGNLLASTSVARRQRGSVNHSEPIQGHRFNLAVDVSTRSKSSNILNKGLQTLRRGRTMKRKLPVHEDQCRTH